jgi:hypothetical protein
MAVIPTFKKVEGTVLRESRRRGLIKQRLIGPGGRDTTLDELLKGVPKGWRPLVSKLLNDLIDTGQWDGYVARLDQRLGVLDFGIGKGHSRVDKLQDMIYAAVEQSATICNQCGKTGRVAGKHELQARCEEHRQEEEA